ncbi:MAG: hypothetical protein CO094_04970 [Anaerolineae bacterium CG_4_9_14_3_um_filter_57_17]|nr:GAF domain-containing protein [bacterium]NCT21769.1 GAF domain-containing protein [bacterium]OIO84358.1 MAG: hypothetical protein AUK01_09555 [Anaerolineae bacterium CG2_30_57_67]PJB67176.1 MAG: hypothetical protein CO094_04970 [Anaerolineae bacterium CG_4_9_14_3_um_filter_57_17]
MCRVLILDDNEDAARQVQDTIQIHNFAPATVCIRLDDALEQAKNAFRHGKPYDIFLIDLVLGPGKDGIEAMKELRYVSPDSDAIIFTGFGDVESGLRAYRAGAFRYLAKPFENQELLFLLEALKERRKAQQENNWQKIFSKMLESALLQTNFHTVVGVVLAHSLELGFERAHLFWIPTRKDVEKGLLLWKKSSENKSIINFRNRTFSDWFGIYHITQPYESIFLQSSEIKIPAPDAKLTGYDLPVGETAVLPLISISQEKLLGALVLDFRWTEKNLNQHERSMLNLFMHQASMVLERVTDYERKQLALHESDDIRILAREVTKKAPSGDLPMLFDEIRRQVNNRVSDVSNFGAAMLDKETNELVFYLLYENGTRKQETRCSTTRGLEGVLILNQNEVFLKDKNEVKKFIYENDIHMEGKIPSAWMGALIFVEDEPIGCIFIQQFGQQANFSENEWEFFLKVIKQLSPAINVCKTAKNEREDKERVQVLQRASFEMMRIAHHNEEYFWLTVLTLATSNFGLRFNCALLFLADDNHSFLRGKMGIGTKNRRDAFRDWERDQQKHYNFDTFLKNLEANNIHRTPFEKIVSKVSVKLDNRALAISDVMVSGTRKLLSESEVKTCLPSDISRRFSLSACALLPLRAGANILGLVIVDNRHTHQQFDATALDRLQTLLDNAGLVWETLRQNQKSEILLDVNYQILNAASGQTLKHTLDSICEAARKISEADWAVIYPIRPKTNDLYTFDTDSIGHDGRLKSPIRSIRIQPSLGGVSEHVLSEGMLKICDMDGNDPLVENLELNNHHFIKAEGVKALIGVPIIDPHTPDSLGILYLDYQHPRDFSDQEIHHAKSFASLAAVAIADSKRLDEQRQRERLKVALETAETISKELEVDEILTKIFQKLITLFKQTSICVLEYDADENALKFAPITPKFYRIQNQKYENRQAFLLTITEQGSIACAVARKSLKTHKPEHINEPDVSSNHYYLPLNHKTRAELCVSLMSSNGDLLGVLALERGLINAFNDDDVSLIETVARQLSLAMERAEQGERIKFLSTVSTMTAWASDIAHDIKSEIGNLKSLAYLIQESAPENLKVCEYAKQIDESACNLSEAGYWNEQIQSPILLENALKQCIEIYAHQRAITIQYHFDNTQDVYIQASLTELKRVFHHLIKNAARAMEYEPEKKITISTHLRSDGHVEILLQDFGPGVVDEEVRAYIFHRQVEKKNKNGGYGLLLVRQLIENNMKGKIKLLPFDKTMRGAAFLLKLPILNTSPSVE